MGKSSNLANLLSGTGKIDSEDIEVGATVSNGYVSSTFSSNTYLQAQGYGTGDVSNNYIQAQGYGTGDVSNNYSTSAYVSNTSFEALKSNSLGRRNLIINGAMQVAQRGTSFACPASTLTYTMDRFFAQPAGSAATTVSQVTDAPVGFQYSARVTRNSGQTGTLTRFETPFETRDIVNLRERKVTVSFYAKAGSNLSTNSNAISLLLFEGNGTERARGASGYDNQTVLINSPKTLTTSWQRFTHTTSSAVSSDTTQLAVQFHAIWTGTAGSNDEFFITGIQLEAGETATPFEYRSYGEELALCQRYYIQTPSFPAQKRLFNDGGSTKALCVSGDFPVTMRASPSITVYGDIADQAQTTLGAQGGFSTTYGFSVFTSVYSGGFVDMHYYISDAEL